MTHLKPPPASPLRRGPCSFVGAWVLSGALGCASGPPPRDASTIEPTPAAPEPPPAEPAAPASTTAPAAAEPRDEPRDSRGKDEIQAVIAANREKVRACYEAARKNNPDIQGDLVVGFVINPDGSVKSAEVNPTESELHVPELNTCALDVLRTLKFPASSRGLESKVNYPFNFKPRQP